MQMPFPELGTAFCLRIFVQLSGADTALGLDLAHGQQGALGQGGAHQFVDQHGEQHHIPGQGTVGKRGGGQGHAQCHARLGQQGDAQVLPDGGTLTGQGAACVGTQILAQGPGDDIHHTHQDGHGIGQDLQVQLGAGQHEKQDVQGHGPALDAFHQLLGGGTDVAEHGAGHHAHQQQGEAAVDGADLKMQGTQAHGQQHEAHGQAHTLAPGVEELLGEMEQEAHDRTQSQGQHHLHDGLHGNGQNAHLTVGQGGGDAEGHGEQQQAHSIVDGDHQHQKPGQGTVSLVLPDHHQGGGGGRGGGDGTQSQGAGNGDHIGPQQMQTDEDQVHQHGGGDGLEDADDDGGLAHGFELTEPELIADGEGDEAQGRLGQHTQGLHLLQGIEAQAGQTKPADAEGAQQQTGHQIGRDSGQMHQLGHSGQQQAAHHCGGETEKIGFHNIPSLITM